MTLVALSFLAGTCVAPPMFGQGATPCHHLLLLCSSRLLLSSSKQQSTRKPPLLPPRICQPEQKAGTFFPKLAQSPGRFIHIPDQSLIAT